LSVEHFIIGVRITNISNALPLKYVRWHTKNTLIAKDEFATAYKPWVAGVASWPVGGLTETAKIEPGKSVVDIFAFVAPPIGSQEIDISLPVENLSANGFPLGKGQRFAFKIGRAFFEKK
jgi:hypothetical protein